jgi:putative CocE/NonD family hydrolase
MSLPSRILGAILRMPPAVTHMVRVEHGIAVPMTDGTVLRADRYYPAAPARAPVILVRSPYGRPGHGEYPYRVMFGLIAELLAERGYQVFFQSVRGSADSGGKMDLGKEAADGRTTVDWIATQPWFGGDVVTWGVSYLGFVQWALASTQPPHLKAMLVQFVASERERFAYQCGAFSLESQLTWLHLLRYQSDFPEDPWFKGLGARRRRARDVARGSMHVPLLESDKVATGREFAVYRDIVSHEPGDDYWRGLNFSTCIPTVAAPVHLIGGWYDYYLPFLLDDYTALRRAGKNPYLTVGPWVHSRPNSLPIAVREGLAWFDAHVKGDLHRLRTKPVRIYIMGSRRWIELTEWPPAHVPTRWHLHAGGILSQAEPRSSPPDQYRYDPADPTPQVGGTSISSNSGPKDNRAVEARSDVLVYTSDPLADDLEVTGPVRTDLHVQSSVGYTDFYARLCDVDRRGRSMNICDGLRRITPGAPPRDSDGSYAISIELWPTAHCFKRGHRIRLQVASGAHPRFSRNPGTGEPTATATTFRVADQLVYHDPDHPSKVVLPVRLTDTLARARDISRPT